MHWILLSLFGVSALAADLKVQLKGLKNDTGLVHYLLFKGEDGFPSEESLALRKATLTATEAKAGIHLRGLEDGQYALSLIYDENANHKLDTFLGIPKENFGFSNDPRIFFGPPEFDKCKFEVSGSTEISVTLRGL